MNKKTFFFILTLLSFILGSGAIGYLYYYTNPIKDNHPDLSDSKYFIAHATGSVYGYTYLNSKESLINSLNNTYQYIEVDLNETIDGALVCAHDWEEFNKASIPNITWKDSCKFLKVPTLDEFRKRKIYGQFTPLTLDDVISFLPHYQFTLVTDRFSNPQKLNKYFRKEIRNRIMVEAFSIDDYYMLKKCGYTPMLSVGFISDYSDCLLFISKCLIYKDIEWIVVDYHSRLRFLRLLRKLLDIKIAASTVNSPTYLYQHLGSDFDLVYTDNWNLKTQLNNYQDHTTH